MPRDRLCEETKREQLTKTPSLPYVQQVVNELEVKDPKATSSQLNPPRKRAVGRPECRPAAWLSISPNSGLAHPFCARAEVPRGEDMGFLAGLSCPSSIEPTFLASW